jgi:hypothetical protein
MTGVVLHWIPLGAGASIVRRSGAAYEAMAARRDHRPRLALYHSALEVVGPGGHVVIEMTPVPDAFGDRRGVVAEGAVGAAWVGRLRVFRYEIRRWSGGVIPDVGDAVGDPTVVSDDPLTALRLLDLVPEVPTPVWGRDELGTGEMWNSNSVTSWLLARTGIDLDPIHPPPGGRAPGWSSGRVVAARHPPAHEGPSPLPGARRAAHHGGPPPGGPP